MGPGAAPDLLVGDIFRGAPAPCPTGSRSRSATGRSPTGELDVAANPHAEALRRARGGPRRPRRDVERDSSIDAVPLFAGLAKLGAVFAPANALLGVDEAIEMVGPGPAHGPRGRRPTRGRRTARSWRRRSACPLRACSAGSPIRRRVRRARPRASRRCGRPIRTCCSSPAVRTGRSKGVVLSHRVNYLRTHPGSQLEPKGPTVCMYPLFHMGAWTMALARRGSRRPRSCSSSRRTPRCCATQIARWQAERLNAIPAVWRRILDHVDTPRAGRDLSVAAHRRLRNLGDAARAAPRHQGARPGRDPTGVLRLHGSRRGVPAARRGDGGEAGIVRCAAALGAGPARPGHRRAAGAGSAAVRRVLR